jgi:hypothetical protein
MLMRLCLSLRFQKAFVYYLPMNFSNVSPLENACIDTQERT